MSKQSRSNPDQSIDTNPPEMIAPLSQLLEAADTAWFRLTSDGRLLQRTARLAEWLRTPDEKLGQRRFADLLAPGSRKPFEELLVLLRADSAAADIHLELSADDATLIPIGLTAVVDASPDQPILECLARREGTGNLSRAQSDLLSRAMELSPDPAGITRYGDGVILDINEAWVRRFGFSRESAIGHSTVELGIWPDRSERNEFTRLLNEHGRVDNLQLSHGSQSGKPQQCLLSARIVKIGGEECVLNVIRVASDIIEARDALRESEERFRAIADYAYDWESWYGTDGSLLWINSAVTRITGYTSDECRAMQDFPLSVVIEDDQERVAAAFQGAIRGTSGNDYEFRIRRKDGRIVWVAASWQPILDADGAVMGHRSSTRDISKRKGAETALRQSEEKFRHLVDNSLQGMVVLQGLPPKVVFANPAALGILGATPEEARTVESVDIARVIHPEDRFVLERYAARLGGGDVPSHYDFRMVRTDGGIIWVEMLATSITYGGEPAVQCVLMDVTERKRSAQELQRRDLVLEAVSDIAQHLLTAERIDHALQHCVEVLGRAAGVSRCYIFQNSFDNGRRLCTQRFEWVADGIQSFLDDPEMKNLPFDRLGSMESVLSSGNVYYGLVRELSPDERAIMEVQSILSIALVPIFSRDTFWGFLGFDECTEERVWSPAELDSLRAAAGTIGAAVERERMGLALRESESRWRSLVKQLPGYVLETDLDGIVRYVNAVPDVLSVEQVMGRSLVDLGSPAYRETVLAAQKVVIEQGQLVTIEVPGMENVDPAWYSLSMGPLKEDDGITGIICVALDITARKGMERALAASEARYRSIAEDQTEYIVRWLPDGTRTFANESYRRCFHLSPEEVVGSNFLNLVTPEYRDRVMAKIRSLTPDEPSATDEHQVFLPDGTTSWQQWTDRALFDNQGNIREIQSVGRDYSELHKAEEALRSSEERFRIAFETSPDSININRVTDGLYVDINEGFTRITGFTREDAIGKTSLQLGIWVDPEDRKKLADGIRNDGKIENLEARFRRKDGTILTGLMSASLIQLDGELHSLNVTRDITALRNAERAALESGQKAQQYLDVAATIMVALDDQGRVTLINRKGIEILGLPENQIVGQEWFATFIPDSERDHMRYAFNQLLTGIRVGFDYYENEVICANNEVRLIAWYNTLLHDRSGRVTGSISSGIDITERSRMERELRLTHEHLEAERDNLEKKNIALGEVLSRIEGEKETVKQTMIENIEENILPVVQKVKALGNPSQEALFEILEEDLRQITSEFTSGLKRRFHGLTPRQLQICRMIKNGHTSKEIAESLGTSLLTVHKHREAIRDKLGIKNRGINLNSYLQSL